MPGFRRAVTAAAMVSLLLQGAMAGRLDDFEKKANKKQRKPSSSDSRTRSADDTSVFGSGTYPSASGGESFLGSFAAWLITAPFRYRHDDPAASELANDDEEWAEEGDGLNLRHMPGSAVLPYLRADYNRQYIDSYLDAEDIRLEAGYKMLAFHGRHTRYMESDPDDDLTINQFYGVFRLGGTYLPDEEVVHGWEIGLGLGGVQQKGNEEHSSGALTVPIKIYPTEWLGFEFRPAWYKPQERVVSDYDLSAGLGWRYFQLRGGYRWLWLQGEGHFFNGPYAGVSVSF